MIGMEDINRLKLVLVEKKKTGKWLAEQLARGINTREIVLTIKKHLAGK